MYYMWGRTKSSRWMQCSLGSMLTFLSFSLHHALAENAIYVSSRWWRMGFRSILIIALNQSITGQSWLPVKSSSRIKLIYMPQSCHFSNCSFVLTMIVQVRLSTSVILKSSSLLLCCWNFFPVCVMRIMSCIDIILVPRIGIGIFLTCGISLIMSLLIIDW